MISCIVMAAIHNNGYGIVSGAIFGITMIVLYTMSSIYHGLRPNTTGKKVMQVLDHCSIFLLIAGSYTPFALCTLMEYDIATRLGYLWNNMGCCNTRNCAKLDRLKKIQSFFYDVLSSNGMVYYCKNQCASNPTWNCWIYTLGFRRSCIYNRCYTIWTRSKT